VQRIVLVDCYTTSLPTYDEDFAIVAVDVIRSTTTAVTALAVGRRCFPVASVAAALQRGKEVPDALLAGEEGGDTPHEFDMANSPAEMHARVHDIERPAILLSSSGTKLLCAAGDRHVSVYAACLRNIDATVEWVAAQHAKVAVVGAGTRGEFREEDQLASGWIAAALMARGFEARGLAAAMAARWQAAPVEALLVSKSVAYLQRTGQTADLQFVLSHVRDLDIVCALDQGEVVIANRKPAQVEAA
jgi:2-phosphosulfolactate phosphatase